jgi:hypothetical protein
MRLVVVIYQGRQYARFTPVGEDGEISGLRWVSNSDEATPVERELAEKIRGRMITLEEL